MQKSIYIFKDNKKNKNVVITLKSDEKEEEIRDELAWEILGEKKKVINPKDKFYLDEVYLE